MITALILVPVGGALILWLIPFSRFWTGALAFLIDYFVRHSPASFLLFAAGDGTLALLTLAALVGSKPIPRTEVTKRLWAYIKKNKLQDAKNKRQINADATLKPIFGGKGTVNMFAMTKLVSKHLK